MNLPPKVAKALEESHERISDIVDLTIENKETSLISTWWRITWDMINWILWIDIDPEKFDKTTRAMIKLRKILDSNESLNKITEAPRHPENNPISASENHKPDLTYKKAA